MYAKQNRILARGVNLLIILVLALSMAGIQTVFAATQCVEPIGAGGCHMTIQAAIDAALDGDTINVAAGTYSEQLNITKSLHLVGAGIGSSIIQAPATLPVASSLSSAIIIVSGSGVDAELTGFTVTGPGSTNSGSIRAGIFVRDAANANIHHNSILDIRDATFSGAQNGVGILVGRHASALTGTATITSNTISGYQKGGIVVDNTGSSATITDNIVTGAGTTTIIAQNGIQISRGATAILSGNTVTGNSFHIPGSIWDWSSAGVLLIDSGSVTMAGGNTVTGNDQNLYNSGAVSLTLGTETLGSSTAPVEYGYDIIHYASYALDATTVTFVGSADNFAIADRIWHAINEAGLGLVTWVPSNLYLTPLSNYYAGAIQRGIDAASAGNTVNVAAGTYTESVVLNKRVSLVGVGATNTIITNAAGGDASMGVIQVSASGLSDIEPLLLKDLSIHPSGRAGISIGRFMQSTGTSVSYLALNNVDVVGTNLNPCTEQERGLYVDNTSSLQYLSITGSSFNNLTYGWYFHKAVSSDASTVQYVTVDDTTFNNNNLKGIYAEKLEDATFTNVVVDGNGFKTAAELAACSYFHPWQAGIDINLKAGTYQNITFVNSEVTNNGLGGAKEGVGLAVKARSDGATYNPFPATLDNVQITGAIITDNERGIRIGEPSKNNAGPTNVKIHTSNLAGNAKTYAGLDGSPYGGVVNQSLAAVDAETNWWGSNLPANVAAEVSGNADFTPWLCSGTDTSTDPGFQPNMATLCPYQFTGFSQPIDMNAANVAKAGQTIPVKWRLTDANGLPISDPGSFAGLIIQGGSCAAGLPTDAIETYSAGSGLQYLGDGYWQYNWKTLKSYTGCRTMYVQFAGGLTSPTVTFQFK